MGRRRAASVRTAPEAHVHAAAAIVDRFRQEIANKPNNPLQQSLKNIRDVAARTRVRVFVSTVLETNPEYGYDAVRMMRAHVDLIGWEFWNSPDAEHEIMRMVKKYIGLRRGSKTWTADLEESTVRKLALQSIWMPKLNQQGSGDENFSLFIGDATRHSVDQKQHSPHVMLPPSPDDQSREYSPFNGPNFGKDIVDSWSAAAAPDVSPTKILPTPRPSPVSKGLACHMCGMSASTPSNWRAGAPCGHLICGNCCLPTTTECMVCLSSGGINRNELIHIK